MTRVVIAFEGKMVIEGFYLKPAALWWDEAPLPITHDPTQAHPLGWATDLRRESDGSITAEVNDLELPEGVGATIYCTDVQEEYDNSQRVVSGARVRCLFLTSDVPWRTS